MDQPSSQPIFSSFFEQKGRVILLGLPRFLETICQSATTALVSDCFVAQNPAEVREQIKDSLLTCVVIPLASEYLQALENQQDTAFRRIAKVIVEKEEFVQQLRDARQAAISVTATMEEIQSELDIAMEQAKHLQWKWNEIEDFQRKLDLLTPDEKKVLDDVCQGMLNKQIAKKMGVSIRTIEQRRRRVFEKMEVESAIPLASQQATFHSLMRPLHRMDSPHIKSGLLGPNSPALLDALTRLNPRDSA